MTRQDPAGPWPGPAPATPAAATVPALATASAPTAAARARGPAPSPLPPGAVRLTWVQPEDLVGHELRQAAEDGRDAGAQLRAWLAAGGRLPPERAGASPDPAPPHLRALAEHLLDELAALPFPAGPSRHRPADGTGTAGTAGVEHARSSREAFVARVEAAWLGRAVGCLLGKPVEKLPLEGIRALAAAAGNWPLDDWFTARGVPPALLAAHPWNRRSAATSLAENIDGMPEDDDLEYPLLNLLLLQRHGRDFGTADVGRLWLDVLPAGRTFTAERIAYRNLLLGLEPPLTATHRNPFREWIGALIRADLHGWTNPGDPARAAAQAARDAALSHTGNGLHAARFAAATIAAAASGTADVHASLRAGLAVVPAGSRLAEAVRHGIGAAERRAGLDFDPVVDELHRRYGHYHWVHSVPNAALIAAALTHADGDFTRSVCAAVSGGWDTDSNGATAGSVAGLLAGAPDRLPDRWTAPLKNRLASTVPGFDGIGFDALARLTASLAGPVNPQEEALS